MCELRITDPTGISRSELQILHVSLERALSLYEPGSVTSLSASLETDAETGDYRVRVSVRLQPELEMLDVSIRFDTT